MGGGGGINKPKQVILLTTSPGESVKQMLRQVSQQDDKH